MRKAFSILVVLFSAVALVGAAGFGVINVTSARAAVTCTSTGFVRDTINLTAAVIDPTGTFNSTINATGCNIGVYYGPGATGTVNKAEIFGANYFGVVNNGGNVTITKSRIHDIGEIPFNGTQHGVAIYFADGSMAKGSIKNNVVYNYQKGGIVVNGVGSMAPISGNTVTGLGPVNFIAQNGIEVGDGAQATVSGNKVTGNSYTGSGGASSGGILVFGGPCYSSAYTTGIRVTQNTLIGNDVGVFLSNLDSGCLPTTTPTGDVVSQNTIRNNAVNNTSGNGPGAGYQAGISDQGDKDQMTNNQICGKGYTPVPTPPPFLFRIDVTVTNHPIVHGNTSC
jgi:Right handed beta helix region